MSEAFKRNRLIEDWRAKIDEMATHSAAVVDFLRENASRETLDPKYVHEQLIRLGDGQATLFASLRVLADIMAATDRQTQRVMKAAGIEY